MWSNWPYGLVSSGYRAPVNRRQQAAPPSFQRAERDGERGGGDAPLREVRGHVPDRGAAPVVSDPDRPPTPEVIQQREHVGNDEFLPVGDRMVMNGGVAVAAHIGRGDPVAPGRPHLTGQNGRRA